MTKQAVLLPPGPPGLRLRCVKAALERLGFVCRVQGEVSFHEAALVDMVYAQQPNEGICNFLDVCRRAGVHTHVDIIAPVEKGSLLERTALASSLITYPAILPYAFEPTITWKAENPRITFNIAIFGELPSQLMEWISATPDARLVVYANYEQYKTLALPEDKKLFIPAMPDEMAGWANSYFDLVCINGSLFDDLPILGAAARGIPWLATDYPASWGYAGGTILPADAWPGELQRLYADKDARNDMAEAGFNHAHAERTAEHIVNYLVNLYTQVLQTEVALV